MKTPTTKGSNRSGTGKIVYGLKKFSAEYGFSMEQIKAVRNTPEGAKAFRSNDVVPAEFCRAFNLLVNTCEKVPLGFPTWKDYDAAGKAKTTWVELAKIEGKLGEHAEFKRQAGDAVGFMFSELDRRDRESPPAFAGRSAIEIAERMEADTKSIKRNLAAKFDTL